MPRIFLLLFMAFFIASCGRSSGQDEGGNDEQYEESSSEGDDASLDGDGYNEDEWYNNYGSCGLEDGTYSATVEYYNENTDYEATYTLDVEVESCEVTVIYWPSGGWSDEDHITAGEIDADGYAEVDGEEGRSYKVYIDK